MRVIIIGSEGSVRVGVLTEALRKHVLVELCILHTRYGAEGWQLKGPLEGLEALIESDRILVQLASGRLMCVDLAQPWFSPEWVLGEEWLGNGVGTTEAVDAMRLLCRKFNVSRFEVGTRASPGQRHQAVARLYQRSGLRPSTIVLEGREL